MKHFIDERVLKQLVFRDDNYFSYCVFAFRMVEYEIAIHYSIFEIRTQVNKLIYRNI